MGRVAALWEAWHVCNARYFGGKLSPPTAIKITRARKYDGRLNVTISEKDEIIRNVIFVSAHAPSALATLLHEMVHQYQVFVMNVDPDHGWSFRCYAKHLEKVTSLKIR